MNGSGTAPAGSASSPATSGAWKRSSSKFWSKFDGRSTVHSSAEPRTASSAERMSSPNVESPQVSAPRPESRTRRCTPAASARCHELVHRAGHGRRHDVGGGDALQGRIPPGRVGPVERGPAGPGGGAHRRAAQPQPGGDPPAGLAGGAENEGGAVGHGSRFWRRRLGRIHGREAGSPVYSSNLAGVDAFGDLFRGVRAQGSLFGSSTLSPPWSLLFVDGAPLTLCTVLEGSGWIVPEGRPPEQRRHRRDGDRAGSRAVRLRRRDRNRGRADRVRRALRDARAGRDPPPARLERLRPRRSRPARRR